MSLIEERICYLHSTEQILFSFRKLLNPVFVDPNTVFSSFPLGQQQSGRLTASSGVEHRETADHSVSNTGVVLRCPGRGARHKCLDLRYRIVANQRNIVLKWKLLWQTKARLHVLVQAAACTAKDFILPGVEHLVNSH